MAGCSSKRSKTSTTCSRGGLFLGTGLHRANVVAAVLEVPGRLGAGPRHRGSIAGEEVRLHPGQALPLGRMGGSQDQGRPDRHNRALTGDDLCDFVNQKLFPYLHGFKQRASGPNTIEYKIGEIFGEIKNKIQSGYNFPRSSTTFTNCDSARRPRSTNCRTCTKPRSGTWATPGATAASTTPRARSSAPWSRSSGPGSASGSTTAPAVRRAFCASRSISSRPKRA